MWTKVLLSIEFVSYLINYIWYRVFFVNFLNFQIVSILIKFKLFYLKKIKYIKSNLHTISSIVSNALFAKSFTNFIDSLISNYIYFKIIFFIKLLKMILTFKIFKIWMFKTNEIFIRKKKMIRKIRPYQDMNEKWF